MHRVCWCFIIFALIGRAAPAVSADEKREREILNELQAHFKKASATARPGIACIVVSRSEHYPKAQDDIPGKLGEFDPAGMLKSATTEQRKKLAQQLDLSNERRIPDHTFVGGVVVDASGLILTPYHGIEGATKIYVFLCLESGEKVGSYANIHAADARSDLAVLKLIHPPMGLRAMKIADVQLVDRGVQKATLAPGSLVGLIAYPYTSGFGLDRPSVSFGGITNVRYRVPSPPIPPTDVPSYADSFYKYGRLLEHDVKLNDALTGGALINLDGELVGLTSATAAVYNRELGPGYAIPMDENIRRIVAVLKKGEEVEYGFLGISSRNLDITPVITDLTTNGPAETAGLQVYDRVTHLNDMPITNYQDLLLYTGSSLAGTRVKITVYKGDSEREVFVTLGKFRHSLPFIASVRPEPISGLRVDYLSILAQQKIMERGSGGGSIKGVSVREVAPNSPAAAKFKTLGGNADNWIITHVNGTPVTTPAEFYASARGQQSVKLTLREWNDHTRRELTLP